MTFIVATNAVASRPPERRPTGTPTACAKYHGGHEDNLKLAETYYLKGVNQIFAGFKAGEDTVGQFQS